MGCKITIAAEYENNLIKVRWFDFCYVFISHAIQYHQIASDHISLHFNTRKISIPWIQLLCCWILNDFVSLLLICRFRNMTSAVTQWLDVDLLLVSCRFKCDLRCYPMWYVGLLRIDRFKPDLRYYQNMGCGHVADWSFQKGHHMLPKYGM